MREENPITPGRLKMSDALTIIWNGIKILSYLAPQSCLDNISSSSRLRSYKAQSQYANRSYCRQGDHKHLVVFATCADKLAASSKAHCRSFNRVCRANSHFDTTERSIAWVWASLAVICTGTSYDHSSLVRADVHRRYSVHIPASESYQTPFVFARTAIHYIPYRKDEHPFADICCVYLSEKAR